MVYVLITYALFLLRFIVRSNPALGRQVYRLLLVVLFLFSAFRFDVGCDWGGYYFQYVKAAGQPPEVALEQREPIWWLLLYYLNLNGMPYPVANVASSAVFFVGVHVLARRQPDPLAFLVLLFPILIINMPMSGIRQGTAVGILCIAFVAFLDHRPLRFTVWTLIAAGFHSSSLLFMVLLPLVSRNFTRSRLAIAALLAIPGGFAVAVGGAADVAIERYVNTGIDAAGAAFRVGILALSGLYFFVFLRRSWSRQFPQDFSFAYLFSIGMITLLPLVPVSSVIADRLSYYFIPAQSLIFARIPFLRIRSRKVHTNLPYLVLALMFATWVALSWHFQRCYVPYQSWLFGFPNTFWVSLRLGPSGRV